MKKIFVLLLASMMVFSLFTFSSGAAESAESGKTVTLAFAIADTSNEFFTNLKIGYETKAEEYGYELMELDSNFDAALQLTQVEDAISQNVDVILIDAVDSNGIVNAIKQAKDAGIIVIAYNSPIHSDLVDAMVVADNVLAGKIMADEMGKAMNGKGQVGVLDFEQAEVCHDRATGFMDEIKEKYPDIEIVSVKQLTAPGQDTALPLAEDLIQEYPDVQGIFAINDESALGCAAAAKAAGKQLFVCGVDANPNAKDAIIAGDMLASAGQDANAMGQAAVETAHAILNGEKFETETILPVYTWTKENAVEEVDE